MTRYRISQGEYWVRHIYIDADSPKEAIQKYNEGDFEIFDWSRPEFINDIEDDMRLYDEDHNQVSLDGL